MLCPACHTLAAPKRQTSWSRPEARRTPTSAGGNHLRRQGARAGLWIPNLTARSPTRVSGAVTDDRDHARHFGDGVSTDGHFPYSAQLPLLLVSSNLSDEGRARPTIVAYLRLDPHPNRQPKAREENKLGFMQEDALQGRRRADAPPPGGPTFAAPAEKRTRPAEQARLRSLPPRAPFGACHRVPLASRPKGPAARERHPL